MQLFFIFNVIILLMSTTAFVTTGTVSLFQYSVPSTAIAIEKKNIVRSSSWRPTDPQYCQRNIGFFNYISTRTSRKSSDDDDKKDTDNIDALVAQQKERAIQYWNESKLKHAEAIKDQVHDDVMQHLQEGKVLPIFHTLCRPPTERLFPPNTRVSLDDPKSDRIQLSSAPVTMGESEKSKKSEISMSDEMSYIPAFVRKNGMAKLYVNDINFRWAFDEKFTKYVTDLVNAPAAMVGEDIEVTKLSKPFAVDDSSGCNLITRRLSRGVAADCFAKSKRRSTYAMVGNPGIGKSWTLIYALQQALLYENVCVLFCMQKDAIAMVCIRRNNKIFVWRSNDDRWESRCSSNLFQNSNVLVLLDPLEATKGGAAYVEGRRILIMAASNNGIHFKSIGKFTGDYARILSCLTRSELKCSLRYMIDDAGTLLPMEVMLERANEVGNLPRYILSDALFKERQQQTANAIARLKQEEVKEILSFDGIGQSTLPGRIFAVNVRLGYESVMASSESIVNSGSFSELDNEGNQFSKVDNDVYMQNDEATARVGYDGQYVNDYGERVVSIISNFVLAGIVTLSRIHILSFWGITSTGKRSEMGPIVESLFWEDLKKPYRMRTFPMMKTKARKNIDSEAEAQLLNVGKCEHISEIRLSNVSLRANVFNAASRVIARMQENEALIDFAGPSLKVYQVTVSPDHSMSQTGLRALFLASGHLEEINGKLAKSENADKIGKIAYYWVVPEERASHWKKKAPKTVQKGTLESDCLLDYVDQYVLVMDNVPIESNVDQV